MRWALPFVCALCLLPAERTAVAQPAPRLDASRLAESALGELPGTVSVGVLRDGKMEVAVRRRERLGQAAQAVDLAAQPGAEPIFEIGSVSKVFNGLLVAQRVERGELGLDDTLGQLLGARVTFRYEGPAGLTVRQLLTHTACLKRWPPEFTEARMLEQAARYDPARLWASLSAHVIGRSPPCETMYSNWGYAALGQVLAERDQRPWEALVDRDIAQPLALRDTRRQLSASQQARLAPAWRGTFRARSWDAHAFAPAGGLHSTATDLLVFSQALIQGRAGPLGPAAERLVTDLGAFGEKGMRMGYGVLLPQAPARTWLHNGETGGYKAEWVVWPDSREALVLLASNYAAPLHEIRRALVANTWTGAVQEIVYTRGEFRGTFGEDHGRRLYARVKLAPGRQVPFSTLTYRVRDARLVEGLTAGMAVEFRAERIDGENTITALRPAARE